MEGGKYNEGFPETRGEKMSPEDAASLVEDQRKGMTAEEREKEPLEETVRKVLKASGVPVYNISASIGPVMEVFGDRTVTRARLEGAKRILGNRKYEKHWASAREDQYDDNVEGIPNPARKDK